MARVWKELVELYGKKAQIKYGAVGGDVFKSWCKKLHGLKPEDIIRGLNACILRKEEWPPELQEFMRLCVDTKTATYHKDYESFKQIGSIKATPDSCKVARHEALRAAGVI